MAKKQKWFEYHCTESEDSEHAELWHHTHQKVTILSKLKDTEISMYKVRFADGFEFDVFGDELFTDPTNFERPDYSPVKLKM